MVIIIIAHQTEEKLSNSADKLLEVKYSLNNFPAVIVVLLVFAAFVYNNVRRKVTRRRFTVGGIFKYVFFGNPQSVDIA
jgi:hypothetical protein